MWAYLAAYVVLIHRGHGAHPLVLIYILYLSTYNIIYQAAQRALGEVRTQYAEAREALERHGMQPDRGAQVSEHHSSTVAPLRWQRQKNARSTDSI
jgi:hypothetical protein